MNSLHKRERQKKVLKIALLHCITDFIPHQRTSNGTKKNSLLLLLLSSLPKCWWKRGLFASLNLVLNCVVRNQHTESLCLNASATSMTSLQEELTATELTHTQFQELLVFSFQQHHQQVKLALFTWATFHSRNQNLRS